MKLKHLRIIIDFTLIIILVLLMCQRNMSVIIHEYMGIGMFILLFGHNILNYKWYKNLFKGKYSKLRILYMVIDSIIILFTILAFISSMMVSGVIFKGAFQNKALGRSLHLFTTAWLFVLMCFHLGLHLESLVMKKYKRYKANKVIMNIAYSLLILNIMTSIYVMIVKRKFYEELFLITSFKNYYKNLFIVDILEIFSMLLPFIIIGIFTRAFILRERSKF